MELKIEKKTYLNAKQYVRIREYKAAVIVCANFLFDYPVSQHRQELSFLKVKSQYKLADMSFESVEKDGEIIEEGNHNSLISKNGFYHRIFKKQQLEDY